MQLVLAVGDKVLDRFQINPELIESQDYIEAMQRLMLIKNELAVLAHLQEPIFYIEVQSGKDHKNIF